MSFHQFFQDASDKKCVTINLNGEYDGGKVLHLESEWNLHDFLNAASNRLGVASLKRIFNSDGVDIDDCMMIEDNDILFLSNGDEFIPPSDAENIEMDDGSNGAERINGTISGFRIGKIIGRGGFGEVRIGEHHLTGEQVALKFLRKAEIISMGAAERTTTEIQCLSALRHQHIIRLQQQLETPHHVVLVLELMEGGDLFNFLYDRQVAAAGIDGPLSTAYNYALPEDEARHVFTQIISAVGYAHNQHICHRDLKLENILLKTKTLECVKIADFGLSAFYRPGALMKSSCGTLSFLAPEVFAGTSNAGPPLDVWAMGVILFALLCGRLPFEGPDLRGTKRPRDAVIQSRISKGQYKIEESLSPEAKDLVRRLLRVDPAVRSSVPEIFSHIWLRSAPGAVTFSAAKSISTSTALSSSGPTPSPVTAHLQESDSVQVEIDDLTLDDVQKVQSNTHGPLLDLTVSSPAASSDLLSPGIDRQDSGRNLQRIASDRGTDRRLSDRALERCATERDWGSKDSDKGCHSELSMSRSKSRSSCEDNEGGGHDHDTTNSVANLDIVSDEDVVTDDLEKVSLPTPSFDDETQLENPTANGLAMLNAENDTIDDLIPLPPPSPSRSGRFVMMGGSRENSFSSRYSETTAGSRDVEEILSPRTPPPSASPFVLVPLRRKDVASEVIQSPRRHRSNTSGLESEDIVRYQSSNDCFDYDSKPLSLSGGSSRNGRHSWTDQVDSQQDKDGHSGSGGSDDRSKPLSPPGVVDSPRMKTGAGVSATSKFSSPTTSRNKLHIAGSLSLKATTISSPAQKQQEGRLSTSPSPRERANLRSSRLHETDSKLSSPPPKDRTGLRNSRFNSPAYTSSPDSHSARGGTVAPPAPNGRASTSHGRKVMRNPNGASGGHII
mmetsp:Transcript_23683/g.40302  ORF Transcript_23683/g.40302 Transcript_23683/m.40302 type:complete len:896 (-) Transcript_23683:1301-3988(-)